MRAKHFETVSQQFHHRFYHHHNFILSWPTFFVDWDSGCNNIRKQRLEITQLPDRFLLLGVGSGDESSDYQSKHCHALSTPLFMYRGMPTPWCAVFTW